MNDKMQKEIKFLKIYSFLMTVALIVISYFMLTPSKEIDVERINVRESNGDLKMVISNSARQHPGIVNGKELPPRDRYAGMIFFNGVGDECGGLIYDGNDVDAGLVLSIDKFREDQVMQLQYLEDTKKNDRKYGLQLWDYPKEDAFDKRDAAFKKLMELEDKKERMAAYKKIKEDGLLPAERLFVGKKFNKETGLFIQDSDGKPRIKIYIDIDNNPKIELLDTDGKSRLLN